MINYQERLSKVRQRMEAAEINVLLVSEPHNIFYLSGSNGGYTGAVTRLIVGAEKSVLIIDRRYYNEAIESAVADEIIAWTEKTFAQVVDIVKRMGAKKVGFESRHVTVKQYERLVKEFEGIQLVGISELIEHIRSIKDKYEIEKIRDAAGIGDIAFKHILDYIRPGVSEKDISIELEFFMRRNGAEKLSFDIIVASGVNSAVPHATPSSSKKVEIGDFVTLDFGAVVDGYHSDMTRTIVVGQASDEQRKMYELVGDAQEIALNSVAPGIMCNELDAVARDIITEAGYGENFVHNLGHGVGLEVHEMPTIGKENMTELQPNMVITVEPGIYVSGFGGVRIEDLAVVNEEGFEVLTHSTKHLIEL